MNRISIAAAAVAVLAVTGQAWAETPTVVNDNFVSTLTRAQVQAELAAYRQAGVNPWSTSYNPLRAFRSTATRDQVTAEYVASRDQVRALTGEDSGSAYFAQGSGQPAVGTTLAGQPQRAQ